MNSTTFSVLAASLLTAVAASGCAEAPSLSSLTNATASGAPAALPTGSPDASANGVAGAPLALYFLPDGTIADAPPSSEGFVPLPTPFNSPFTGEYPAWSGKLASAARANGSLMLRFFVTAETVSIGASALPIFAGLPGMEALIAIGNVTYEAALDGPTLLRVGEVVEITATFALDEAMSFDPGAAVEVETIVYYSHAAGVAEFRFVMGPEHPARIEVVSP